MPPRHVYWTIILEGKPTAFRAHSSEELLPTLKQLQARHPDTVMRWFARGRLWASPEEERIAAQAKRPPRERRPPGWRPGGEHKDPRDRFKVPRDEKRRRFAAKQRRERDGGGPPEPGSGRRPETRERRPPNRWPREGQRGRPRTAGGGTRSGGGRGRGGGGRGGGRGGQGGPR